MLLLISSIVCGFLGFYIGGSISGSEFIISACGLIGFSIPYAFTIDKIYTMLSSAETRKSSEIQEHISINKNNQA